MGDALIDLIAGEALYRQYPDKPEGELSRFRAELVRGSTLAEIAREIGLNAVIRLGEGEKRNSGAERESILSGALEALIGAVYLDSDFETCREISLKLFARRIQNIQLYAGQKDAKTRLQELMQSRKMELPVYQLTGMTGKQHQQVFHVTCQISALGKSVEASGDSKKMAEQAAAQAMLELVKEESLR